MKRLLKLFVYVSIFLLVSSISKNKEMSSSSIEVDTTETNYHQKNSPREKTLDFLLAHHFFEMSHAIDNQSKCKLLKYKNPFLYITAHQSGSIHANNRLFTQKIVNNLFLFKDSHYIFRLRKIII